MATTRRPDFDVIVVGARCAGAATAMLLARAGLEVLVFDRGRPGTDTLSTHALMRGGVLQLHRWGVLDDVIAAGTPPIDTVVFDYPDERVPVGIKPSQGVPALFAPRRTVLDPILVDAAREAGATFRFQSSVTDVVREGERVVGVQGRQGSEHFTVVADLVVGADGVRSRIADAVEAPTTKSGSTRNAVVYGYWRGVDDAVGYEWFYRHSFATGVIKTNEECVLVFTTIDPVEFGRSVAGDLEGALHSALMQNAPELADRLRAGDRVERLRGFNGVRGFARRPWGPGWALVGDSAYFKDPITVHGITDALRDAELVARAIIDGSPEAFSRYEAERDRVSARLFEVTEKIAANDWTMDELKLLLREMSSSMSDEVTLLEALEPTPAS